MKTFTAISLVLLIYMPSPAAEELLIESEQFENKASVEKYYLISQQYLITCKFMFTVANIKSETEQLGGKVEYDKSDDYEGCIDEGRNIARVELDKAILTLKKTKAQDALKNFHVAFITALEGVKHGINERKISYDERQQALEDKLTEAWARFELEQ